MQARSVVDRFWDKVVVPDNPDACWGWRGSTNKGYAQLSSRRGASPIKAHRLSWELYNGEELPDWADVCHSCDNPLCTNPRHLSKCTHRQNMAEAHLRGGLDNYHRGSGESNNAAILTWDSVREIRNVFSAGGVSLVQLARDYGVHPTTIGKIVRNQNWIE